MRAALALGRVVRAAAHLTCCLTFASLAPACDPRAQFTLDLRTDAGHPPPAKDAGKPLVVEPFDAGESVVDAGTCVEDASCKPESSCRLGRQRCGGEVARCEPQAAPYVTRGTLCPDSMACDGEGHCAPCGDKEQACCNGLCHQSLVCAEGSTCQACKQGAKCELQNPCLTGVQECGGKDPGTCKQTGNAARMTSCGVAENGDLQACDGKGKCEACGGEGQPCCAGSCSDGNTCDVEQGTCFKCSAGKSCDSGDACKVAVESCSGGKQTCVEVDDADRGTSCGDAQACDGEGKCTSCGAADQPCCKDEKCSEGLVCDKTLKSCFACKEGDACKSASGCRAGTLSCSEDEAVCKESSNVARAQSCGADHACDGSGSCAHCGESGEPCCGSACASGQFCDADTLSCGACDDGSACSTGGGCQTGTRKCADGQSSCINTQNVVRGKACGADSACDGSGACKSCGGVDQPCCGTTCDSGALCSAASTTCRSCPDGMVLVPAGGLDMGALADDALARADEKPVHHVTFPAFCADRTEVTVSAYAGCASCAAAGSGTGCNGGATGREQHPINCVDHTQATAFCAARGARLPTEAEWEYMARRPDARLFPWGASDPSCTLVNGSGCGGDTVPVGQHAAGRSALGIDDLAGNVSEWVSDRYAADFYGSPVASGDDPKGPDSGSDRAIRGGYFDAMALDLRATARDYAPPTLQGPGVGFRCVKDLP